MKKGIILVGLAIVVGAAFWKQCCDDEPPVERQDGGIPPDATPVCGWCTFSPDYAAKTGVLVTSKLGWDCATPPPGVPWNIDRLSVKYDNFETVQWEASENTSVCPGDALERSFTTSVTTFPSAAIKTIRLGYIPAGGSNRRWLCVERVFVDGTARELDTSACEKCDDFDGPCDVSQK